MNKIVTLRSKVVQLGKFGFLMTALTILTSLLYQEGVQISIWSGEPGWLCGHYFEGWAKGFTSEELNQSDQKGTKILAAVHLSEFLFRSATSLTILLVFRAMWQGRAITRKTATLVMVLGILCFLGIMDIDTAPIPLDERTCESIGNLTFSFSLTPFREITLGLLTIAASRIINFANILERQLEDIV
jgi:hypothetical protein